MISLSDESLCPTHDDLPFFSVSRHDVVMVKSDTLISIGKSALGRWAVGRAPTDSSSPRLSHDQFPSAVYAIGDVHGRLDLLSRLEAQIAAHATQWQGHVWIILLGDLIDRGPDSAQVIEHLIAPADHGHKRIVLSGNHDDAMINAMSDRTAFLRWCDYGGLETLQSYGFPPRSPTVLASDWPKFSRTLAATIPAHHIAFIKSLPLSLTLPGFVFVHAGLVPGLAVEKQAAHDMRNFRGPFPQRPHDGGYVVVHGHTIFDRVTVTPGHIAVDTGAYQTGRLSAVCLTADGLNDVLEAKL